MTFRLLAQPLRENDQARLVARRTVDLAHEVLGHPAPGFAMLDRGDLRLALSSPSGQGGGGQAIPDGTVPEPGGWNRFMVEVTPPVRSLPVDVRVGAYGVIIADDRILLTHWNEHGRTGWTLPGGGMEEYEAPQQAAVREIREETGFDTEILDILGVDSMYLAPSDRMVAGSGPLHALRIVFRARIVGGSLTHEIGGSSDEARWVPLAEVAALPTVSLVGIALRFRAERG